MITIPELAKFIGVSDSTIRWRIKNNYYLGTHSYIDEKGERKTIVVTRDDIKVSSSGRTRFRLSNNLCKWAMIEKDGLIKKEIEHMFTISELAKIVGVSDGTIRWRIKNNYYLGTHSYIDEEGEEKTIVVTHDDIEVSSSGRIKVSNNLCKWAMIKKDGQEIDRMITIPELAKIVGVTRDTMYRRIKNNYYLGTHSYIDEKGEEKTIVVTHDDIEIFSSGRRVPRIRLSDNLRKWAIIEKNGGIKNGYAMPEVMQYSNDNTSEMILVHKAMERMIEEFGGLKSNEQKRDVMLVINLVSALENNYKLKIQEKESSP